MNLEEALDFLIEQVENWRADTKGDYSYWDEFMLCTETLLRCADQEWQRRELALDDESDCPECTFKPGEE